MAFPDCACLAHDGPCPQLDRPKPECWSCGTTEMVVVAPGARNFVHRPGCSKQEEALQRWSPLAGSVTAVEMCNDCATHGMLEYHSSDCPALRLCLCPFCAARRAKGGDGK
jgi:hypothetical protein